MLLTFEFKNINNYPVCSIHVNDIPEQFGSVEPILNVAIDMEMYTEFNVKIYFMNKSPDDTVVDAAGNIIQDKNFELVDILMDGVSIGDYRWEGEYVTATERNKSCLFFGPPGHFEIALKGPGDYKHLEGTTDFKDFDEQYKLWQWAKETLKI